jgi:hypothetical protein
MGHFFSNGVDLDKLYAPLIGKIGVQDGEVGNV